MNDDALHYVRHNLCIPSEDIRNRWMSDGTIAIHYEDNPSWEFSDYKRKGKGLKQALKTFNELNEKGGWIIADYSASSNDHSQLGSKAASDSVLIGEVERGSKESSTVGIGCSKYKDHGLGFTQYHIYKTLRIKNPQRFSKDEYDLLRLPFGRSTACKTKVIRMETLQRIYNRKSLPAEVDSLHPSQLELICHEYLRRHEPRLAYLLSKIGEQLKDIDIFGCESSGKKILAQVSHSNNPKVVQEKVERLSKHQHDNATLVYFGPIRPHGLNENVRFVPIHDVFEVINLNKETHPMIQTFLLHHKVEPSADA